MTIAKPFGYIYKNKYNSKRITSNITYWNTSGASAAVKRDRYAINGANPLRQQNYKVNNQKKKQNEREKKKNIIPQWASTMRQLR